MTPQLIVRKLLTEGEIEQQVAAADLRDAARFSSVRRQVEFLTWRTLVREVLGADADVIYNEVGAPVVLNRPVFIGVSHCSDRVAVSICERPCAVDIERTDRNFSRAAARYLSPVEASLSLDPRWAGAVWCAKECLYKYAGRLELDFLRDLQILAADLDAGTLTGAICNGDPLLLNLSFEEEHTLVSIL